MSTKKRSALIMLVGGILLAVMLGGMGLITVSATTSLQAQAAASIANSVATMGTAIFTVIIAGLSIFAVAMSIGFNATQS